jgi:uncharacterized protein (UPF0262 family)
MSDTQRIANISLDEKTVIRRSAQVEHERKVAIYDLLDENEFSLIDDTCGPYNVHLAIEDNRLVFDVRDEQEGAIKRVTLPGSTFRKTVKDYFLICESYFDAIKTKTPSQIEAIDMARRGLHNEGAELLKERMAESVEMDKPTARRLFTLVCVLHIRA